MSDRPDLPPAEEAAPAVPAAKHWTRHLITLAIIALGVDLVAALVAMGTGLSNRLSLFLGIFLLCFAALKIGVATDSVLRMRSRALPSPTAWHGSAAGAWGYVAYKYAAALVAILAGVYLLTVGADAVDHFVQR